MQNFIFTFLGMYHYYNYNCINSSLMQQFINYCMRTYKLIKLKFCETNLLRQFNKAIIWKNGLTFVYYKIIFMLKFLEGRQQQPKQRNSIQKRPYIAFGISLQAPTSFQSEYSMISPSTYVNPFVDMEQNRTKSIPLSKRFKPPADWVRKADISQVQEGKVIGSGDLTSRPDRYHQLYNLQLRKNSSRFRLTKGQFTDYLSRNRATNDMFGPLIGQQRSVDKSLQTKKSVMRQSHLHLQKSKEKLQLEKSLRKESSRILQKIIDERRVVRKKRDDFTINYHKQLSDRKTFRNDFELPKILPSKQSKSPGRTNNFGLFKTIDNSMLSSFIK